MIRRGAIDKEKITQRQIVSYRAGFSPCLHPPSRAARMVRSRSAVEGASCWRPERQAQLRCIITTTHAYACIYIKIYTYTYIYIVYCVCACVRLFSVRERQRERGEGVVLVFTREGRLTSSKAAGGERPGDARENRTDAQKRIIL